MELKVGMYVRTKKGKVYKFTSNKSMARVPYMINCSFDIKELVEENDILMYEYDNKICVSKVEQCGNIKMLRLHSNYEVSINCVKILKILTKEQFEENSYRIGD